MVSNMNPKLLLVELKQPLSFLFFPLLSLEEVLLWQPRLSPAWHRKWWSLGAKYLLYCPRGLPKRTYFILPGETGEIGFQWQSPGNYGGVGLFLGPEGITCKVRWEYRTGSTPIWSLIWDILIHPKWALLRLWRGRVPGTLCMWGL